MADTRIGVIGCGGRMGRMLVAEIGASEGCTLAGGSARPGSALVGSELGGGLAVTDSAEALIRASDVVIDFTAPGASSASGSVPAATASIERPRAKAERRKWAAATTLLAAPWRHTNSTRGWGGMLAVCSREYS